ncbi:hypothetical protein CHS0354_009415 [Potamilus streckersoni]|uniref:Origin recognition complex subunit 6 n=1 Tax=Potamilus streckersoni TaxID=2493646 RepID=A0AAE0T429_9BIVA|nr:hypothetical protein CHS0354_009415 [Potamilus streckersoni]
MMDENMKIIGSKLGITSQRILRKAEEYSHLVDVRASSTSLSALKLTGSSKIVLCLDLAASACNHVVDKASAVRLSGLQKKLYCTALKAVENLLDLQEKISIKELAVQFGCTDAIPLAQEALHSYEEDYNSKACQEMDFTTLLFQGAALCAACRNLKLKMDRSKLLQKCGVKKTIFDRLVADLEQHIMKAIESKKIVSKKRPRTLLDEVERQFQDSLEPNPKAQKMDETTKKVDYAEWKRRILEAAAQAKETPEKS